jgi:diketogulonate reductase-like aldo/keto reductase
MAHPIQPRSLRGVALPPLLYGTAWKEESTAALTALALSAGFRGIDTANQRKHYHEKAVGEAVRQAIAEQRCSRAELFLQSKYTYQRGQDQRLPYDPRSPIAAQLAASFDSSLAHFGTDYLDGYLLHGPSSASGLTDADWEAWRAMEALANAGRVRLIGISNVSLSQLAELHARASVKPAFVQNRCYASRGWDAEVRAFCDANDLVYQGFSLLTANRRELTDPRVTRIAERHGRSVPEIVFAFSLSVGMLPLTGTSDLEHMKLDLDASSLTLETSEVDTLLSVGT